MKKLKRHDDAILCIFSPKGPTGTDVITASDNNFRIWSFKKKTIYNSIGLVRPTPDELDKFMKDVVKSSRLIPAKAENLCVDHPLNSVSPSIVIMANGYRRRNISSRSNGPRAMYWSVSVSLITIFSQPTETG